MIAAAVCGLVVGVAALKVWKLSIFLIGAGVGLCIWLTVKALFPQWFEDEAAYYISLIATIIVFGLISTKMEKTWLLFGSPVLGAFVFVQGIDTFVEEDLNVFQILDFGENAGCNITACYVLYSMVIVLSIVGFLIQYFFTSEEAVERRKEKAAEKKGQRAGRREAMKERRRERRKRRKYSYSDSY